MKLDNCFVSGVDYLSLNRSVRMRGLPPARLVIEDKRIEYNLTRKGHERTYTVNLTQEDVDMSL